MCYTQPCTSCCTLSIVHKLNSVQQVLLHTFHTTSSWLSHLCWPTVPLQLRGCASTATIQFVHGGTCCPSIIYCYILPSMVFIRIWFTLRCWHLHDYSAEPRLESFYPPLFAGIDLPHPDVVDSYSLWHYVYFQMGWLWHTYEIHSVIHFAAGRFVRFKVMDRGGAWGDAGWRGAWGGGAKSPIPQRLLVH